MPDLSTTSFDGFVCRDEVTTFIANRAVTGAPFARSLTPFNTDKHSVAFPTALPEGFGWVSEGAAIPDVDMNDDAYVVAVAKLAGLVTLSNESVSDADYPLDSMLGKAVSDSMGPKLDNGLLFGAGAPAPEGILAVAPEAMGGPDFRADVIGAWGEIVDEGGDPEQIVAFASGAVVAYELARTTTDGVPIHADGSAAMIGPGVRLVAVPQLSGGQVLVVDRSALYLVLRSDFSVDFSEHAKFGNDQTVARVKGRFAVACATPEKSMRKITAAS
jgi:hypothetical protein